jgi:hypothetical protein
MRAAPHSSPYGQQCSSGAFVEQGAEFHEFPALSVNAPYEHRYGKRKAHPAAALPIWLVSGGQFLAPSTQVIIAGLRMIGKAGLPEMTSYAEKSTPEWLHDESPTESLRRQILS